MVAVNKGFFISFEGGEGSGKSTHVKLLANWLLDQKINCITTREPGGTKGAEEIRNLLVQGDVNRWDPLTELFL
ncbi:MAG: thymidylate kinase, partial [Alphaproteobacteria bacterium]|nr:thymidylate kinase [Alphaproteobacteria bacterium]